MARQRSYPAPQPNQTGALPKYFKNETGAVEHLGVPGLFQIALLSGREVVVENNETGVVRFGQFRDLHDLALTDERGCFGRRPRLHHASGHHGAGAGSQLFQFVEGFFGLRGPRAATLPIHSYQDRPFRRRVESRGDLRLRQFGRAAGVTGGRRGALRHALLAARVRVRRFQRDDGPRQYSGALFQRGIPRGQF